MIKKVLLAGLLFQLAACGSGSASSTSPEPPSATLQATPDHVSLAECRALKVGDSVAPFLTKYPHPYSDDTGTLAPYGTVRSLTWPLKGTSGETWCGVSTDEHGTIRSVAKLAG